MEIRSAGYRKNNEMIMTRHPSLEIAQPIKKTVLYFFAFILVGILFSWLFAIDIDWNVSAFQKKLIFITAFLAAGIIHVSVFPRVYSQQADNTAAGILLLLSLSGLMGISSFLVFVFTDFEKKQFALLALCAFLLPTAIQYAWKYFDFTETPEPYKAWLPQTAVSAQNRVADLVSDLPIRIRLKINDADTKETTFRMIVPARLTLGKMFQAFLSEQETKSTNIQLIDQHQKPFAWRFVLQKTFSITNLEPDLTMAGNEIKPKTTILAERVRIS